VVSLILVDVNILIYAHVDLLPQHRAVAVWLDDQLNGISRVGLPWEALIGFLRIVTHPRVFPQPLATSVARRQQTDWLGCPTVWVPRATEQHAKILGRLLAAPGIRANIVHDAHLAALAIEHGLTLCSTDRDFARFPGLRWENPIAS
jgi:toxin-antitoxin system PIN domain toxin